MDNNKPIDLEQYKEELEIKRHLEKIDPKRAKHKKEEQEQKEIRNDEIIEKGKDDKKEKDDQ